MIITSLIGSYELLYSRLYFPFGVMSYMVKSIRARSSPLWCPYIEGDTPMMRDFDKRQITGFIYIGVDTKFKNTSR